MAAADANDTVRRDNGGQVSQAHRAFGLAELESERGVIASMADITGPTGIGGTSFRALAISLGMKHALTVSPLAAGAIGRAYRVCGRFAAVNWVWGVP
jgi:hypothetical protein